MDTVIWLAACALAALGSWMLCSLRAHKRISALQAKLMHADATLLAERSARAEQLSIAEATLLAERNARAEQASIEERMREAFAALSQQALTSNASDVLGRIERTLESRQALAQSELSGLISPLKTTLSEYRQQLSAIEQSRERAYGSIEAQLKEISSAHQQLSGETSKLISALRQPHVRGRWGELQLRRVVELAGMSKLCDFAEQPTTNDEEQRKRPDLTVRLPNQRCIVVDSKAPLAAYIEAHEASDEQTRSTKLKQHAKQVREHVNQLASKAYQNAIDSAPDFVVLFIPGDVFYHAAIQHDAELLEHAFTKNIILANPSTLIALLKAVALGWQEQRLAENAAKIQATGTELYKRLAKMTAHFNTLGKQLNRAVEAYNSTIISLESRVLVSARRLHELDIGDIEINSTAPLEIAARQIIHQELTSATDADQPSEDHA